MHTPTNTLLGLLAPAVRGRIAALCDTVPLLRGQALRGTARSLRNVYFPIESSIALTMEIDGRRRIEVGVVGGEGMLGPQMPFEVGDAPLTAGVRRPGGALRMQLADFNSQLVAEPTFARVVDAYARVLLRQMAATAACVHYHKLQPRLARWLLVTRERGGGDEFEATHQVLAQVLGVRRPGVTVAASALQAAGLIEYHRGMLTIVDLPGLEAASCSCYAADARAYAELMQAEPPEEARPQRRK